MPIQIKKVVSKASALENKGFIPQAQHVWPKNLKAGTQAHGTILGIDLATLCGLSLLTVNDAGISLQFGEVWEAPNVRRFDRWFKIANRISALTEFVDLVVIEGYSFMSKFNIVTAVELGAVVRAQLVEQGKPILEVPPMSLKKFVAGVGNAKKEHMLLNVFKRWDISTRTNNEADAVGLAILGGMYKGILQSGTQQDRDLIKRLGAQFPPGTPYLASPKLSKAKAT